ncbi:hypothetical protein C818_02800 [Lachnospiraceae bacterium MD308]|jgi:conserved hypothetical protein|nr:hypothetical protein C818_02800 [Lachnospiraceae bacterium MD308]MCI8503142.1 flippase-like domain-containing protein [Dorea sp.]
MSEKGTRKFLFNIGVFTAVMLLTFWFVFRSQDISRTVEAVQKMSLGYLAAAFLLAVLFVSAEGCMIWYLLKGIGEQTRFTRCIGYSFIGFFFSGLTPSATGGQPMQLYYMKKDGNSLSASSVVLMSVAVVYKLVLVLIGIGIVLFWNAPLKGYLQKYYGLYFLGLFLNTALVLILLLVMFSPSVIRGIFYRAERIIVGLRLWKESGARREKMEQFLAGYQGTVCFLKENKKMIWVILGGTFLQRFTVFVLTYVVYRGLGLSGTALLDIVFVQASVYIAVDMLPVPGAQGITEAMYICVFGGIFTGHYLAASMCITRGISFYAVMVIGAAVFAAVNMRKSRKRA